MVTLHAISIYGNSNTPNKDLTTSVNMIGYVKLHSLANKVTYETLIHVRKTNSCTLYSFKLKA